MHRLGSGVVHVNIQLNIQSCCCLYSRVCSNTCSCISCISTSIYNCLYSCTYTCTDNTQLCQPYTQNTVVCSSCHLMFLEIVSLELAGLAPYLLRLSRPEKMPGIPKPRVRNWMLQARQVLVGPRPMGVGRVMMMWSRSFSLFFEGVED